MHRLGPALAGGLLLAIVPDVTSAASTLDGYALFALERLRAKGLVVESGDVGVATGPLAVSGALDAPSSQLTAPVVRLEGAARCAGIRADRVTASGSECRQAGTFLPAVAAAAAETRAARGPACDASSRVRVSHGDTATLAPGSYGAVTVDPTGELHLSGGEYAFCSLVVRHGARVVFDAPADVTVSGMLWFRMGSSGLPAAGVAPMDVRVTVSGDRVRIGHDATVAFDLSAPAARLELIRGADLTGRFVARDVRSDRVRLRCGCPTPGTTTTTTVIGNEPTTTTTTTTMGTSCGNGVIDAGEECDGDDLGGATCNGSPDGAVLDGSPGGAVVCTPGCRLDFSGCVAVTTTTVTETTTTTSPECPTDTTTTTLRPCCGNGIREPGEECDGRDLGGATCNGSATGSLVDGSPGGAVVCTDDCTLDFSGCVTTTTVCPPGGSTTTVPGGSTTTTLGGSTTTTLGGGTTTTVIGATTTTIVGIPTTTTPASTTTTTAPIPGASTFDFVTVRGTGSCGESRNAAGAVVKSLSCGGLNLGGGASSVAEGPTPDGATSRFAASCTGTTCTLSSIGSAGANFDCTAAGCFFGTPLPIANFGTSTCVVNRYASNASGTVNRATGAVGLSVSLTSAVFLTGNHEQPCPRCSATGTPANPGTGTCQGGATPGAACTTTNSAGYSRDCLPGGGGCGVNEQCSDGSLNLGTIPVNLGTLTTGSDSMSAANGQFCPGQAVQQRGCFGSNACTQIAERGEPAGALAVGTGRPLTLASVFCIPETASLVINLSASLPGPGATALDGIARLNP